MTKPLPPYGRALTGAVARQVVTPSDLKRLRDRVCMVCDEDVPNCRCPKPTLLRRNDDGTVTWIAPNLYGGER